MNSRTRRRFDAGRRSLRNAAQESASRNARESAGACSVRLHHQARTPARNVRNDSGAPVKLGDSPEIDGKRQDDLLAFAQSQIRRLDEDAGGAEIDGLAELPTTTGNSDVDGGTSTVPRMQAAFHWSGLFLCSSSVAGRNHYANVCLPPHGPSTYLSGELRGVSAGECGARLLRTVSGGRRLAPAGRHSAETIDIP
jgi:hypothetical protein